MWNDGLHQRWKRRRVVGEQARLCRDLPHPRKKAPALTNPLVLKLEQRDRLSDEERQVLEGVIARTSTVEKGQDMVREGETVSEFSCVGRAVAPVQARARVKRSPKRM